MPDRQESISEDMLYLRNNVAKEYGGKGQITGKRKNKERNKTAEMKQRTEQGMCLAFAAEENRNPGKRQSSPTQRRQWQRQGATPEVSGRGVSAM